MSRLTRTIAGALVTALAAATLATSARAQVGRTAGMLDPNLATEAELTAVPNITPELAKTIIGKRPFLRPSDFTTVLAGLSKEQQAQTYA